MRGKAFPTSPDFSRNRITPAYAGKSYNHTCDETTKQDHPRLCGEKRLFSPQDMLHAGSPPPMRGKAKLVVFPINVLRITPAYAGKSF